MSRPEYVTSLDRVGQIPSDEIRSLRPVCDRFAFRSNTYYLGLVDWEDPHDPIRRLVIPSAGELEQWGRLDASNERRYTVVPGLQHKYEFTAVLLVSDACAGYCRFCFRKRLFIEDYGEAGRDTAEGIAYIREHPLISNVLLTGGDPLMVPTRKLTDTLAKVSEIPHVRTVRIGTKVPAYDPLRIVDDKQLLDGIAHYSRPHNRLYAMVHFNHPRELTEQAVQALGLLARAGVVLCNQTPLLRGVNDDPAVLAELFNRLTCVGVAPYYVFQGRPTQGNRNFAIPVERSLTIFEQARARCSGLAKRARFVMSHATGKIEVLGLVGSHVLMRYHRAADPRDRGRLLMLRRNPEAFWFDEYDAGETISPARAACEPAMAI